jgi:outer membrane protein TolC
VSVLRSRRPIACLATLSLVISSTGCGSLREWAYDAYAPTRTVATPPQMPAIDSQGREPGAMVVQQQATTSANKPLAPATPAIPPPAQTMPLDLSEALGLAGAENPTIAIARTAVEAALAEQLQARALLLPNLNAGTNYDYHAGVLQSSFGAIREVDRQALDVGAGTGAVGAGTIPVPGVQLYGAVTDAIYAPRIANKVLATRQFDASATNNNVLLDVGVLYYALIGAEARLAAVHQSETDLEIVVKLTADHAAQGQGREADADRARSEALLLHQEELRAQEEVAVASARLAQLLNIDPSTRLVSRQGPGQQLMLVNLEQPVDKLIETALRYRPELAARSAAIQASQERYHEEQARPFLPTLLVGYSAGGFGGGSNLALSFFGNFGSRSDVDAVAFWTWQDLGLGNLALQRRRRAEMRQAEADQLETINTIRNQVAESLAQATASQRKLSLIQRQLERAGDGVQRDLQRVRGLAGLPIEVLNSVRLLSKAREDYVLALTQFNQAQLRLFVSLGQPPR